MPSRFRLTNENICQFDGLCRRMTQRELLAHTYAFWRAFGRRLPGGKRFPTIMEKMPMIIVTAETSN